MSRTATTRITTTPDGLDVTRVHGLYQSYLPMWIITERPTDYPDGFVARMHLSLVKPGPRATDYAVFAPTIDLVRCALPVGLFRIPRDPNDAPKIVETWL